MAIYQPSQIVPDVRSGLGLGVIDVTQGMTVSWRINGPSALSSYSITIYTNDADSTQKYTTGQITTGCPAYGTTSTGTPQFFSYTIPAATLSSNSITNGNEYKLIIKEWWSANDSVTQSSASVFVTRATPSLTISAIGTGGVISTRYYTFTGNYSQAQGDVLNWFRWQIARADDTSNPFLDSGEISGTMQISCYFDGFFADTDYCIRLTCQTENGVEADTGWVGFSASYTTATVDGEITAGCVGGTDAVLVEWGGIGYIPGIASGPYTITDYVMHLPSGSTVEWDYVGTAPMSFAAPWSIVWKGDLGYADADIFTLGQSGGNITLKYDYAAQSLILAQGGTTLVSQSGIINAPTVTVVLTATDLYIRSDYLSGGLYPTATLYPSATLYPGDNTNPTTSTYTFSPSYTQTALTSVSVGGMQACDFLEAINGTASAATIAQAITNGTYNPGLVESDYLLANWKNGLDAGTLDVGGDSIQGFALYRAHANDNVLVKITETGATTGRVYDYGALSQQGPYVYYLFPIGTSTYIADALTSGTVMPCWWNYSLMECEATDDENIFTVLSAYRFRYNIETAPFTNNNNPTILQNFTPYPKVQLAPQNYKSASLTGLIGMIDYSGAQPEYVDSVELRDAIFALSLTQNPLFLKTRKGELIRVRVSAPITMQTGDGTKEQTQTMTLPWVEVGSAKNVSLYALSYAGVQEAEGEYHPQFYVDTSDATADAANIRTLKTAYGADGKLIGTAKVSVSGKTLVMPDGMEE